MWKTKRLQEKRKRNGGVKIKQKRKKIDRGSGNTGIMGKEARGNGKKSKKEEG